MSLFISYSHADKDFVDKLGAQLILKKVHVWVDRWELNVGDSITERVQEAILEAANLLVVLSKNSVASNWCKREINSGLLLELERKNVVVMPVLIEDCEIPLFLRDKLYADFRKGFDEGLQQVIDSLTSVKQETTGRVSLDEKYFVDFSCSWGIRGGHYELRVDLVNISYDKHKPFTVLTSITFVGNDNATNKFFEYQQRGLPEMMKNIVFMLCAENPDINQMIVSLQGDTPFETRFGFVEPGAGIEIQAFVTVKMLGVVPAKEQLYYLGHTFVQIWENTVNRNI